MSVSLRRPGWTSERHPSTTTSATTGSGSTKVNTIRGGLDLGWQGRLGELRLGFFQGSLKTDAQFGILRYTIQADWCRSMTSGRGAGRDGSPSTSSTMHISPLRAFPWWANSCHQRGLRRRGQLQQIRSDVPETLQHRPAHPDTRSRLGRQPGQQTAGLRPLPDRRLPAFLGLPHGPARRRHPTIWAAWSTPTAFPSCHRRWAGVSTSGARSRPVRSGTVSTPTTASGTLLLRQSFLCSGHDPRAVPCRLRPGRRRKRKLLRPAGHRLAVRRTGLILLSVPFISCDSGLLIPEQPFDASCEALSTHHQSNSIL